jgi:hypothetical protein
MSERGGVAALTFAKVPRYCRGRQCSFWSIWATVPLSIGALKQNVAARQGGTGV